MNKYWKLLIPILLALAIALGLIQNSQDPYANKMSFVQPKNDSSLEGYFNKAKELAKNSETKTTASFLAVGDIMLSRKVALEIKKSGNNNLPFSKMAPIFSSVDFSFGNLETPLSENNPIIGGQSLIFSSPALYAQNLKTNNFKILNLANNHALDQGIKGLEFTQKYLDSLNISHIGTGKTLEEAWQGKIVEANGIKIGFVGASYASINDNGKTKNNYVARIDDLENLKASILNMKSNSDFVVVTMHAGVEYTRTPNQAQINFAHSAIDFGADLVIGAHPHWVQTTEKYCPNTQKHPSLTPSIQGGGPASSLPQSASDVGRAREGAQLNCNNPKYIFYSLGNFIFDQEWSQDTKEGMGLRIKISDLRFKNKLQGSQISAKLDSIELIPVIIENYSTPRPATEEESKKILEKIEQNNTVILP